MAILVNLSASPAAAQTPEVPSSSPAPDVGSSDFEILNRGPLHEAFAEVDSDGTEPGIIVPRAPPDPVSELPPEIKPAEDVEWIPGYWAWDEDRQDFIWVSGVWRRAPPGRRWIPGHWVEATEGWQWVSGFWAPAGVDDREIRYQPYPPESLEMGPSSPPPGDDYLYVPGSWEYVSDNYQWRPGYWSPSYSNWAWVPSRYVWTPRGCIYRIGYWDYPPVRRGCLFAPVYFPSPVYLRPAYFYTPQVVFDFGPSFFVHLFVRPRYCHYYYGDFYAPRYRQHHILPWVDLWAHPRYYDPMYAFYRYQGGRHTTFLNRVHDWNNFFHRHEDHRPAHTWREVQRRRPDNDRWNNDIVRMAWLGSRFDDLPAQPGRERSFVRVDDSLRQQFRRNADPFRELQRGRADFESRRDGRPAAERSQDARAVARFKLPELNGRERQSPDIRGRPEFPRSVVDGQERGKERTRSTNDSPSSSQTTPNRSDRSPFLRGNDAASMPPSATRPARTVDRPDARRPSTSFESRRGDAERNRWPDLEQGRRVQRRVTPLNVAPNRVPDAASRERSQPPPSSRTKSVPTLREPGRSSGGRDSPGNPQLRPGISRGQSVPSGVATPRMNRRSGSNSSHASANSAGPPPRSAPQRNVAPPRGSMPSRSAPGRSSFTTPRDNAARSAPQVRPSPSRPSPATRSAPSRRGESERESAGRKGRR